MAKVGERWSPPEGECLTEESPRDGGIPPRTKRAPLAQEPFEAASVELVLSDVEEIAGLTSRQTAVAEDLAQLRHVDVHAVCSARRRPLAPELVDQACGWHDFVGIQEQLRKKAALLLAAELCRLSVQAHLERAEEEELHRSSPCHQPRLTLASEPA